MTRHREFADRPLEEFRDYARLHIEVLNAATANIPADRMRVHLCWGNYPGPHHRDVPLEQIIDLILNGACARALVSKPPTDATRTNGRCSRKYGCRKARC